MAVEQVGDDRESVAAVGGARRAVTAAPSLQTRPARQTLDASARMLLAVAAQLGLDTRRAVDPPVGGEDAADVAAHKAYI